MAKPQVPCPNEVAYGQASANTSISLRIVGDCANMEVLGVRAIVASFVSNECLAGGAMRRCAESPEKGYLEHSRSACFYSIENFTA